MSEKSYPNKRDCEHGQLRRACPHCEANEESEQLQKTNQELLEALESMANLFPERPVKDGSGGIGWSDHVGNIYDQAQSAITNAKQVMGDKE